MVELYLGEGSSRRITAGLGYRGRRLREREVLRADDITRGEDDGALDTVLELTHVAGPVVGLQPRHGVLADRLDLPAMATNVDVEKMLCQAADISWASLA